MVQTFPGALGGNSNGVLHDKNTNDDINSNNDDDGDEDINRSNRNVTKTKTTAVAKKTLHLSAESVTDASKSSDQALSSQISIDRETSPATTNSLGSTISKTSLSELKSGLTPLRLTTYACMEEEQHREESGEGNGWGGSSMQQARSKASFGVPWNGASRRTELGHWSFCRVSLFARGGRLDLEGEPAKESNKPCPETAGQAKKR